MNMKHLRLFHAVAEAGSVSAAAGRLHISQPAVTRQLKDFEARLGTVLFHRLPRGMRTTEAGALLQDYARRIFALEREAERGLGELDSLEAGELAVGASTTIGDYLLPPIIATFRQRYPRVILNIEIANTERIEQRLDTWQLMLGFTEGPSAHPALRADVILQDELLPVVGAAHPLARRRKLALADLADATIVLRESGSGTRRVVEEKLREHAVSFASALYIGSTEAIKRVVNANAGVAWLPRISVTRELESGALVRLPLKEMTIYRPLYRIQRPDRRLSTAARAFLDLLAATRPGADQAGV